MQLHMVLILCWEFRRTPALHLQGGFTAAQQGHASSEDLSPGGRTPQSRSALGRLVQPAAGPAAGQPSGSGLGAIDGKVCRSAEITTSPA